MRRHLKTLWRKGKDGANTPSLNTPVDDLDLVSLPEICKFLGITYTKDKFNNLPRYTFSGAGGESDLKMKCALVFYFCKNLRRGNVNNFPLGVEVNANSTSWKDSYQIGIDGNQATIDRTDINNPRIVYTPKIKELSIRRSILYFVENTGISSNVYRPDGTETTSVTSQKTNGLQFFLGGIYNNPTNFVGSNSITDSGLYCGGLWLCSRAKAEVLNTIAHGTSWNLDDFTYYLVCTSGYTTNLTSGKASLDESVICNSLAREFTIFADGTFK